MNTDIYFTIETQRFLITNPLRRCDSAASEQPNTGLAMDTDI